MRDYTKIYAASASAEQLAVLVPAFEAAWTNLNNGGSAASDAEAEALKQRLAAEILNVALSGVISDAYGIAALAVLRLRGTVTTMPA